MIRFRSACCLAAILVAILLSPVPAMAFHVTLECTADEYGLGEPVLFVWANDTDSTVTAGMRPVFQIYVEGSMEWTYPPSGLPMEYPLGPHQSVSLSWDQTGMDWQQVPPGDYEVRIGFWFDNGPPVYEVRDHFRILGTTSAPTDRPPVLSSWGEVKALFGR